MPSALTAVVALAAVLAAGEELTAGTADPGPGAGRPTAASGEHRAGAPATGAATAAESDDAGAAAAAQVAVPPLRPVGAAAAAPLLEPHVVRVLGSGERWPAGSVQQQLDRDGTRVPYGRGAVFVPAMVAGFDEPPISVWDGDRQIAEGLAGARLVVPPGRYQVRLGSGSVEQRFARAVEVTELSTTVVPVDWGGMTVHVMDPQLNSLRQAYEIIRMQDRVFVGVGFGVDEQAGEPVATWVLRPGLYKLVRAGGTYRDRTDFATVRLLPGMHTHFLVVADRDTGDFKGAGEARPEELFRPGRGLRAAFLLGGEASLIARQGVAGYSSGQTYDLQGFLDTKLNVELGGSPLLLRLQVVEGQQRVPNLNAWVKTRDNVQLDLLYVYGLTPTVGPYLRSRGITNLFASTTLFAPPRAVTVMDGSTETTTQGVDQLALSPAFGAIDTLYGAGLNMRVLKTLVAEATLRTGLGLQQVRYRHVLQDVSTDTEAIFDRLVSYTTFGVEATLIGVLRLTRYVVLNAVLDTLVPFDRHQKTSLDLDASLSVKLTQYASVNYRVRYNQRPSYLRPAIEQDVRLRFSLEIL